MRSLRSNQAAKTLAAPNKKNTMAKCTRPFIKTDGTICPCGKYCANCINRRKNAWAFRIMEEAKVSISAYFITFTYDIQHVPITNKGLMTLDPPEKAWLYYNEDKGKYYAGKQVGHFQKFMRKLRKATSRRQKGDKKSEGHQRRDLITPKPIGRGCPPEESKIKYYAVGEYGTRTKRPHYHAIIFNATLDKILKPEDVEQIKQGVIPLDGKYQFESPMWEYGHITIGKLTEASSQYILKYIQKQKKIPLFKGDDRTKEWAASSKGLGLNYINEKTIKFHQRDINRQYLTKENGEKVGMPRYYKDRLYQKWQRELVTMRLQKEELEKHKNKDYKTMTNDFKKRELLRIKQLNKKSQSNETF